jgi:hypothetical protein
MIGDRSIAEMPTFLNSLATWLGVEGNGGDFNLGLPGERLLLRTDKSWILKKRGSDEMGRRRRPRLNKKYTQGISKNANARLGLLSQSCRNSRTSPRL